MWAPKLDKSSILDQMMHMHVRWMNESVQHCIGFLNPQQFFVTCPNGMLRIKGHFHPFPLQVNGRAWLFYCVRPRFKQPRKRRSRSKWSKWSRIPGSLVSDYRVVGPGNHHPMNLLEETFDYSNVPKPLSFSTLSEPQSTDCSTSSISQSTWGRIGPRFYGHTIWNGSNV